MVFGFLTSSGLKFLRHGSGAPIWRSLVTLDNSTVLNFAAAVVVAAAFAYAVKKLFFQLGPGENPQTSTKLARFAPYLTAIPFLVMPACADDITMLSPFFVSLVPSALALALLASLNRKPPKARSAEDEYPPRRWMRIRLLLSGALAAVGAWEGTVGIAATVVLLALLWMPCVCQENREIKLMGVWFGGFLLGFAIEGFALGWDWDALHPVLPPVVALIGLFALTLVPVAIVRTLGENRWVMLVWGIVLVALASMTLVGGHCHGESACERFTKRVLADLGERKLIIGDGWFDDFFREFKPADVRLIGTSSNEDREFLLNFFSKDTPITNQALVVRHYYHLEEMKDAARELNLVLRKPERPQDKSRPNKGRPPERERTAAAVSNEVRRLEQLAQPALKSINEMMKDFKKIPPGQRRAKIDEARENIRRAWRTGFSGLSLSSTILALDILLNDWSAAEADSLTALMINREDPAANGLLGNIRLRGGRLEEAEKYLRKGVKGGGAGPFNDLAMLLLRTKRLDEAEEWARKALAKAPNDPNVHDTLMQVLRAQGKADEAQKEEMTILRFERERKERQDRAARPNGGDSWMPLSFDSSQTN